LKLRDERRRILMDIGTESKALGVHVQLGPVGGPLGKIPVAGRNWEGFSNDPYLSGVGMAETVEGMQAAGVQACAKHFSMFTSDCISGKERARRNKANARKQLGMSRN
jgi:beta-glucosidase-like glycosyl hydrolase